MRLHTLTLQAVGPFAGRHTVDFAALSAGGLFLLEGPTGAGKSTVIDAVVFALYGKVASASASEDRLRSAFAADDVETVVDLVFETGSGVYRVRRTPAYERAKKRGTGRAKQQATVKLWRLTAAPEGAPDPGAGETPDVGPAAGAGAARATGAAGDRPGEAGDPPGELLSTRLDEAGAELTRVVGLDRAQFVQTMVLPQGEFAAFLRADPEQRRGLLQRIFGTEVYERVQQRLDELRREAQRAVTEARTEVQECTSRFAGAAAADEDGVAALRAAAAEDTAALAPLVADRLAALRAHEDAARAAAEAAARRVAEARAASDGAGARLRLVRRRAALEEERARLAEAAEQHAADVARVDRARRAAVARPVLRGLDDARGALAGADKELRAALDAAPAGLAPADPEAALADAGLPAALAGAREASAALVATLTRVVGLERTLPERGRDRDRLREVQAVRTRTMAEADDLLAVRPEGRAALVADLDAAAALAGTAPTRARDLADAEAVAAAVRDLAAAEAELAAATDARAAAAHAAVAAVEEESRLRRARLAGFAGELAAGLASGEPCPVCGGTEHPHPAPPGDEPVAEEDVAAAEDARRAAEEAVRAAEARVEGRTERCAALRERTGGLRADQGDVAAEAVSAARAALAAARDAEAACERLRADVAEHDRVTDDLRLTRAALGEEHVAAGHALARVEDELARDAAEVEAARDGQPTVLARQGAEQARVDAADGLLAALDRRAAAARAAADRAAEVARVLAEQDLGDEAAARAAIAEAADVAAAERAVEAYRAAVARVEQGLRDPELADLAAGDPRALAAEVAELEQALADAVGAADAAGALLGSVRDRAARAADAARHVTESAAALTAAEQRAAPVARMARLAGGADADNARALSLATYVLVRRFEDVVAAANDRLREMSDGRYELERSDEREDVRTRRTGLAMRVVDHTTGAARDPRTLSGGETFYVSLCLALGMADVVTAEAGGVELGTLFIDEGFGTLDPHTLDAVLGELGRLRAGGRVVGVVSHVEALKQAVAERIEVRRRADGSSTLTVVAG